MSDDRDGAIRAFGENVDQTRSESAVHLNEAAIDGLGESAAVRAAVSANPQFAVMIDPGTLDTLATQVATTALPADQLSKVDQMLGL